jgi:molybdopterin/thiamine biosynthesis adenylyltransferase
MFQYDQAFDRNLGWLSPAEQAKLRQSCVAIAGVGGAGGFQAQALARLGVGKFKIADPDHFELTNFNRQMGATLSTLDKPKVEVIEKMILDINPEAEVEIYRDGINAENMEVFLKGVNFAVDGIDFFVWKTRRLYFETCYAKKIPVLTCCPIGFGAALMIFSPDGMRFSDYFNIREGMDEKDLRLNFVFGLAPVALALKYMSSKTVDFESKRASSVVGGLMLVGAITAAEAVKVLTGKGKVKYCPHVFQVDLFTQQLKTKWMPLGMKSPWRQLKVKLIRNFLKI